MDEAVRADQRPEDAAAAEAGAELPGPRSRVAIIIAAVVVIAAGVVLLVTTWMPWGSPLYVRHPHTQSGWDIYSDGYAVAHGPNLGGRDSLTVSVADPQGTISTGPVITAGALAYVTAGVLLLLGGTRRLRGTPRRRSVLPRWTAFAVGVLLVVGVFAGLFALASTSLAFSGETEILVGVRLGLLAAAVATVAIAAALVAARRRASREEMGTLAAPPRSV
jgi:hypothetical protein